MTWDSTQFFRDESEGNWLWLQFFPPSCSYAHCNVTLQKLPSSDRVSFPCLEFGLVFWLALADRMQQKQWYARSSKGPAAPILSQNMSSCHMKKHGLAFQRLRPHEAETSQPSWGYPPLAYSQWTPKHIREPSPDLQSFLPKPQLTRDSRMSPAKTRRTTQWTWKLMNQTSGYCYKAYCFSLAA